MAHPEKILFSVNEYDRDGDITESGIFLHFGTTRIKAADSIKDFREIVGHLEAMIKEIEENHTNP